VIGTFERDGVRFAYESLGDGEPVILLHGLGGDRAQALGLVPDGTWKRWAIDLRGHGDTEPVGRVDAFNFATFSEDVASFLDAMGIEVAVLGGVSLGAGVALRFALDYPTRVRALGLIRPAWIHVPLTEGQLVWPEIVDLLRAEGREKGLETFRASETYARVREVSEYAATSLCSQFADPRAVERVPRLDGLPRSTPYDDPSALSRVLVPALVVGASRDPQHPLEFANIWARGLPRSRLVEVTSKAIDPDAHNRKVREAMDQFLREAFVSSAVVDGLAGC
jgi:pimeloyl-ACP methyl ester carboxylesterase